MTEQITYPSVTRILEATKPLEDRIALEQWRERVGIEEADRISKSALERGRKYDSFVEAFYIRKEEIPHKSLAKHLSNYELHSLEQNVVSVEYGYKGRYDCIFKRNDTLILNDFKGSSKYKKREWLKDYPLQISAYINAVRESGIDIGYGMISVILDNKIQQFCFNHIEIEKHFNRFLERLNQYNEQLTTNQ